MLPAEYEPDVVPPSLIYGAQECVFYDYQMYLLFKCREVDSILLRLTSYFVNETLITTPYL